MSDQHGWLDNKTLDQIAENQRQLLSIWGGIKTVLHTIAGNLQENVKLMSQITDFAGKEDADLTSISAAFTGIVAGVTALDVLIQNFQNSPDVLTAADQAALDAISAKSTEVVAQGQAVSTKAPGSTPPAPPAPPAITSGT